MGTQHRCMPPSSANARGMLLARQSRCSWAAREGVGFWDHPTWVPTTFPGAEVAGRAAKHRCPSASACGACWAMLAPALPPLARATPGRPCLAAGTTPWGCSASSGPRANHRALGRPLHSLFNEAPCLIRTGRPAFIKRALAGGGFGDGPDLRMLDPRLDPQTWGRQREIHGHSELWSWLARSGGWGWGLMRRRLTKRRGCTACCAFKKSRGIATPPLHGNSVCLGKLPAASPGASLLSGRWPCLGRPAVRWP